MSSSTSHVDRGGDDSDWLNLTDREVTGDGEDTNMLPTTMRTY